MSNLKLVGVCILFVGYTALVVDRSYNLGRDSEHNRLMWALLTRETSVEPVPTDEQASVYRKLKWSGLAFNTPGDRQ